MIQQAEVVALRESRWKVCGELHAWMQLICAQHVDIDSIRNDVAQLLLLHHQSQDADVGFVGTKSKRRANMSVCAPARLGAIKIAMDTMRESCFCNGRAASVQRGRAGARRIRAGAIEQGAIDATKPRAARVG